jgi:hypothetical protein
MKSKLFWPAVALLLCTLCVVQVATIRQETQTWDEGFELASGYCYLKSGEYRISLEHPPLARVFAALPLLILNPSIPFDHPSWQQHNDVEFGQEFLYKNRVPADTMLFAARAMMIALTLCLGLAIALWTRRQFGTLAAVLALLFFVFDPNVIANGRYVKNDVAVALFGFLTCVCWSAYLEKRRRTLLAAAGILLGCAITTKFSALYLLPVLLLLAVLFEWRSTGRPLPWRLACQFAALLLVAGLTAAVIYLPHAPALLPMTRSAHLKHPDTKMLQDTVRRESSAGRVIAWTGMRLGLPSHPLPEGVGIFAAHNKLGHPAYLLGMHSERGWWYYFPVAFVVKTPLATLLALAIVLWAAVRSKPWTARFRDLPFAWFVLLVPILVYLPLSMSGHVNGGVRHLLPIYPFLFILIGAALPAGLSAYRNAILIVLTAALLVESLAIYPYYLAFFNAAAGGPGNGPHYLLDSNLDWGQDVKRLNTYLVQHGIEKVCLCYFGKAQPEYYGVAGASIPITNDAKGRAEADCVAAISATPLYGLYVPPDEFAWLRARTPIAKIGYSIYLYDLRKNAPTQ